MQRALRVGNKYAAGVIGSRDIKINCVVQTRKSSGKTTKAKPNLQVKRIMF